MQVDVLSKQLNIIRQVTQHNIPGPLWWNSNGSPPAEHQIQWGGEYVAWLTMIFFTHELDIICGF